MNNIHIIKQYTLSIYKYIDNYKLNPNDIQERRQLPAVGIEPLH